MQIQEHFGLRFRRACLTCWLCLASLACALSAQADFTTLHSFRSGDAVGYFPEAIAVGPDSSLYGVAEFGGANNFGTVFRLVPGSAPTVLYTFHARTFDLSNTDGAEPLVIAVGPDGTVYGATGAGGVNDEGTLFKITPSGVFTVLHTFWGVTEGDTPCALTVEPDGSLYGANHQSGAGGMGTIFKVSPEGVFRLLHTFSALDRNQQNSDGGLPTSVTVGADGTLYGATASGGRLGLGTLFKITPDRQFHLLYSFPNGADGFFPTSLLLGADGSIYGAAQNGGMQGSGTLFQLTSQNSYHVLHTFLAGSHNNADGKNPCALAFGPDGDLYGVARGGGQVGNGTAFKLTPAGVFSVLHTFSAASFGSNADGINPNAIAVAADGSVYGTTPDGGNRIGGALFRIGGPILTYGLNPAQVYGGERSTATLQLAAPAPAGGTRVTLSSNTGYALVPTSVTVPQGQVRQTFAIVSRPVPLPKAAAITANSGGASKTASLIIYPPALKYLTLSPTTVRGGYQNSVGAVTLTSPAPPGGTLVTLSSNTGYALVPVSVTVPAGSRTASFTVTTRPVTAYKGATITASQGGVSKSVGLLLTP